MDQPIGIARYALAYLLWAITVVLAIVALLVWRSTAFIILGMTPWDRYAEHALNQFGFLFLAIVILGVIIFAENYLRSGVERNRLLPRFFLITLVEVAAIWVAHVIQWIGGIVLGFPEWLVSPLVLILELTAVILFFILHRQFGKRAITTSL